MVRTSRCSFLALASALAFVLVVPLPAAAQRDDSRGRDSRHVAGVFDYYALALSWSPTYCASGNADQSEPQCSRRAPRPYAFVLHGLWPQYTRRWPENCPIGERPFVPQSLIDRMLDIMPSKRLIIHEYRKHGTCSGLDPEGYFGLSRRLFESLKIPRRYINPAEAQFVNPGELVDEFVAENPKLERNMMVVECGGSGNRLKEIRICYDKQGNLSACGQNENQRRLCSADRMYVPPVRFTPDNPARGRPRGEDDPEPQPKPRLAPGERVL